MNLNQGQGTKIQGENVLFHVGNNVFEIPITAVISFAGGYLLRQAVENLKTTDDAEPVKPERATRKRIYENWELKDFEALLNIKTFRALKRAGIITVAHIIDKNTEKVKYYPKRSGLYNVQGIGSRGIGEIAYVLRKRGVVLPKCEKEWESYQTPKSEVRKVVARTKPTETESVAEVEALLEKTLADQRNGDS